MPNEILYTPSSAIPGYEPDVKFLQGLLGSIEDKIRTFESIMEKHPRPEPKKASEPTDRPFAYLEQENLWGDIKGTPAQFFKYLQENMEMQRGREEKAETRADAMFEKQQSLLDSILEERRKPRQNPNIFLNALDHYIGYKQRGNPNYQFRGLMGRLRGDSPVNRYNLSDRSDYMPSGDPTDFSRLVRNIPMPAPEALKPFEQEKKNLIPYIQGGYNG